MVSRVTDESVESAVRIAQKQQVQACIQFKSSTLDLVSEVFSDTILGFECGCHRYSSYAFPAPTNHLSAMS